MRLGRSAVFCDAQFVTTVSQLVRGMDLSLELESDEIKYGVRIQGSREQHFQNRDPVSRGLSLPMN